MRGMCTFSAPKLQYCLYLAQQSSLWSAAELLPVSVVADFSAPKQNVWRPTAVAKLFGACRDTL